MEWLCALSSCVCGSEWEEKWRASFLMMSGLVISVRCSHLVRDVILAMWCSAEKFRILRNWGSLVLQEESNPNRAKDYSASRVYESQSTFFRLVKVR